MEKPLEVWSGLGAARIARVPFASRLGRSHVTVTVTVTVTSFLFRDLQPPPPTPNMDIFNRPPTIAEDTVIYSIYPPPGTNQTEAAALSALITTYVQDSLLPANHIWHRDSFELHLVERDGTSSRRLVTPEQLRLEGTMRVGDAVDDEWCVVWLLYQISQHWPDVVIRQVFSLINFRS